MSHFTISAKNPHSIPSWAQMKINNLDGIEEHAIGHGHELGRHSSWQMHGYWALGNKCQDEG